MPIAIRMLSTQRGAPARMEQELAEREQQITEKERELGAPTSLHRCTLGSTWFNEWRELAKTQEDRALRKIKQRLL